MEFQSLASFATHLLAVEIASRKALEKGLDNVAKLVQADAKQRIGEYQDATGPFPAWAPLKPDTIADRVSQGFTPDDPLLRSGDMRESIEREVQGLEAAIGSKSDIALYQEMGTATIPPRPFLGPAAYANKENIQKILGEAFVSGLTGQRVIEQTLGYDFTTSQ